MKLKQYLLDCYTDSFRTNGVRATCSEVRELLEAIKLKDWKEAQYEFSQVCLYLLILCSYGLEGVGISINPHIPNWMPWEDDYRRMQVWKEILRLSGAPNQTLDLEWFNKGNNWERPHKVMYVLSQVL